ncbi:MAG: HU family DNA-binding protein [Phycisphaerae bacterium]|nr:HU family DNA-binding protein [Phycisphaerae bacterium]
MTVEGRKTRKSQGASGVCTSTKKELVERVVQRTGYPRVMVLRCVQEFLDQIVRELKSGHRLEFRDFGVFELHERAARTAQNPRTLEKVAVPARKIIKFKPGLAIRTILSSQSAAATLTEVKPARKRAAPM